MGAFRRQHSIIRLHNRDEFCWGVVDEKGALLNLNGLSMRLTRDEAQIIADDRNATSGADLPNIFHEPDYTAAHLRRLESVLATGRSCIERQRRLLERLDMNGHEVRAAQKLLEVFSEIVAGQEIIWRRIVDYFHTLPDARDNPAFRAVKEARKASPKAP